MAIPLPLRGDGPRKRPEGLAGTRRSRDRAQREPLLVHLWPGAQPLFCALFLIAARVVAGIAGEATATPLHVLAYLSGGTGSAA